MKMLKALFLIYARLSFKLNMLFVSRSLLRNSNRFNYFFRVKIRGNHSNTISCEGNCKIYNSSIKIKGKNNHIVIAKNTEIRNSEILIKGNNNVIEIKSNCRLNKILVIMEKDRNKLHIEEKQTE